MEMASDPSPMTSSVLERAMEDNLMDMDGEIYDHVLPITDLYEDIN